MAITMRFTLLSFGSLHLCAAHPWIVTSYYEISTVFTLSTEIITFSDAISPTTSPLPSPLTVETETLDEYLTVIDVFLPAGAGSTIDEFSGPGANYYFYAPVTFTQPSCTASALVSTTTVPLQVPDEAKPLLALSALSTFPVSGASASDSSFATTSFLVPASILPSDVLASLSSENPFTNMKCPGEPAQDGISCGNYTNCDTCEYQPRKCYTYTEYCIGNGCTWGSRTVTECYSEYNCPDGSS